MYQLDVSLDLWMSLTPFSFFLVVNDSYHPILWKPLALFCFFSNHLLCVNLKCCCWRSVKPKTNHRTCNWIWSKKTWSACWTVGCTAATIPRWTVCICSTKTKCWTTQVRGEGLNGDVFYVFGGGMLRLTLFCVGCGGIAVLVNNVLGRRKCIVAWIVFA